MSGIVRLDGNLFARMLKNGLNNLRAHESEVNKLNVFPIADGDTGTNMRLTLENGLKYAAHTAEFGTYLASLSNGMLLGARGNSGVILSQLFKGMYLELSRASTVDAADLRNGLIRAYRNAYASVVKPVEGTVLTVAREGIENIRRQIGRRTTFEVMLSMYVAEMKKSLDATPKLLDILKEAGVVDSGAMGYIIIIEGMLKYLYGEKITYSEKSARSGMNIGNSGIDLDSFNENSSFDDGYCLEFLLQLMSSPVYLQNFRIADFTENLGLFGNSIVAVEENKRVKVHIHTKKPDKVMAYAQQFGEFLLFKLENMQLQHNDMDKKNKPEQKPATVVDVPAKKLAVVSVADGQKLCEFLRGAGCDHVIDGGKNMNPSSSDFLDAVNSVNAGTVVILPNNKNSVGAAEQAKTLYSGKADIRVLSSESVIDAYYALAMDISDSEDTEYRISQMESGISGTHTLGVAVASKDFDSDGVKVAVGDRIASIDGQIVCGCSDTVGAVISGLEKLPDIAEKSTCLMLRGADMTVSDQSALEKALAEKFPDIEFCFIDGGQHIFSWLAGLI